ncbi:MAG: methyltransferase domain-containing protein [Chloroflexi bacterium]|nr:methyltransferase domain-containing protein [Chloroflexota bacterium]MDQ3407242.1 class I SAM-dependent methyltransferase [Chloroflexota bacterium]
MSALPIGGFDRSPSRDPSGIALFERHPAIYGLWREHLFRDDTERICASLWGAGPPTPGTTVLEVGCGPGHYARRLAARFDGLMMVGIDSSEAQLRRARAAALARGLSGCSFERGDARALPRPDGSVAAVIVSRLFTVLRERDQVMSEIHRVLRPGGFAFVAEPRSAVRTGVALGLMRLTVRAASLLRPAAAESPPPGASSVMDAAVFGRLMEGQPWARVQREADRWYQYAVCEKEA